MNTQTPMAAVSHSSQVLLGASWPSLRRSSIRPSSGKSRARCRRRPPLARREAPAVVPKGSRTP